MKQWPSVPCSRCASQCILAGRRGRGARGQHGFSRLWRAANNRTSRRFATGHGATGSTGRMRLQRRWLRSHISAKSSASTFRTSDQATLNSTWTRQFALSICAIKSRRWKHSRAKSVGDSFPGGGRFEERGRDSETKSRGRGLKDDEEGAGRRDVHPPRRKYTTPSSKGGPSRTKIFVIHFKILNLRKLGENSSRERERVCV